MQVISGPFTKVPEKYRLRLEQSSVINSPGFLKLWSEMGGSPNYWMVLDDDGNLILTVGSVVFSKPLFRSAQFGPDGLYFFPLMQDYPEDMINEAKKILWISARSIYQRVHLSDFAGLMPELDKNESIESETLVADIDTPDWLPPDKKLQAEIRKAERERVICERFDPNSHFDSFIGLMHTTEERHGRKPKYNENFFHALAALAASDPRIDWSVVKVENRMAAAHINLIEGAMLINWQVYYDKQFSSLKPNQYLLIDAIRRGWSQGVRRVNFGATPEGAEGVRVYKEKWGGVPHQYHTIVSRRGLGWIR